MKHKEAFYLILRYLILIILPLGNLFIFYYIFTPLTIYPVLKVFNYLYEAVLLEGNIIFFKGYYAEIISACVAGSAYYLLLILNLTTPINLKTRIKSIIFLMLSFYILNILRIIIFGVLLFKGYEYFDLTHKLTWYFGSTLLVILIWFVNIYLFKIKEIPVVSDAKRVINDIKR